MIKNIIFDFGDVFLNLNKTAPFEAFKSFGLIEWHKEIREINEKFEVGKILTDDFLNGFQKSRLVRVTLWQSTPRRLR